MRTSGPGIIITFDSIGDQWVVERHLADCAPQRATISFVEMSDEYNKWYRAGSPGSWGQHAYDFCCQRLEVAVANE